jgi:hypothetical protein
VTTNLADIYVDDDTTSSFEVSFSKPFTPSTTLDATITYGKYSVIWAYGEIIDGEMQYHDDMGSASFYINAIYV